VLSKKKSNYVYYQKSYNLVHRTTDRKDNFKAACVYRTENYYFLQNYTHSMLS